MDYETLYKELQTHLTLQEQGKQYEDFVTQTLYQLGQILVSNKSFMNQVGIGENVIGWEIKNVQTMKKHNALYVEVAEKSKASNADYVPSGILRNDNTIFMVMGDYDTFYVLQKKRLRAMYEGKHYLKQGCWDIPPTPTSKGFGMPLELAEKMKVFKVVIENGTPRIER